MTYATSRAHVQLSKFVAMYVCPTCKATLDAWRCTRCQHSYTLSNGFPVLLPKDTPFSGAMEAVEAYEDIYTHHSNVWENQGRTPEFLTYFSGLLREHSKGRLLEVGCGEGLLLSQINAEQKVGTELSVQALVKTQARTAAQLCIALGEHLPFADGSFDLVTSVGVMEHFIDDRAASAEIRRVLRDQGHYVMLIHVHLTAWQRAQQKVAEYLFPRPRPLRLLKWLVGKFYKPVHQPVQNTYTIETATACLQAAGLRVQKLIHRQNSPAAPLIGPHVVIFVCEK